MNEWNIVKCRNKTEERKNTTTTIWAGLSSGLFFDVLCTFCKMQRDNLFKCFLYLCLYDLLFIYFYTCTGRRHIQTLCLDINAFYTITFSS